MEVKGESTAPTTEPIRHPHPHPSPSPSPSIAATPWRRGWVGGSEMASALGINPYLDMCPEKLMSSMAGTENQRGATSQELRIRTQYLHSLALSHAKPRR